MSRLVLAALVLAAFYYGFKAVNERMVQQKIHSDYDGLSVGMGVNSIVIPWKGDDNDVSGIRCKDAAGDVSFQLKVTEWTYYAMGTKGLPEDCQTLYFTFLGQPWRFDYSVEFDPEWKIQGISPLETARVDGE